MIWSCIKDDLFVRDCALNSSILSIGEVMNLCRGRSTLKSTPLNPLKSTKINMRRLLHILDFADSHPTPCAVFSLNAEKAFDRLEWNYMWAVLQCFGFGEHFVSMIKTLYHSPAASVITGNIISTSFPLQRGTRHFPPYCFVYLLNP